jgi:hypothetical protein
MCFTATIRSGLKNFIRYEEYGSDPSPKFLNTTASTRDVQQICGRSQRWNRPEILMIDRYRSEKVKLVHRRPTCISVTIGRLEIRINK